MGKGKIYLTVKVQTHAREQSIEKTGSGEYRIRVTAPPSQGKANREVVGLISSFF
ncbi:DUF167 domain-containing protein, partial [Acidobacteriota bacterium]